MKTTTHFRNSKCQTFVFALLAALNLPIVAAADYKHVAVPAQDIPMQQLAPPSAKGVFSHSTMQPVFQADAKTSKNNLGQSELVINKNIYFDGSGDSPILFLSPDAAMWNLSISDPNGKTIFDEQASTQYKLGVEQIAVGNEYFSGKKLLLQTPVAGRWQIQLRRQSTPTAAPKQHPRTSAAPKEFQRGEDTTEQLKEGSFNRLTNRAFSQSSDEFFFDENSKAPNHRKLASPEAQLGTLRLQEPPEITPVSPSLISKKNSTLPIGYLLFKGDPNFQVYSHLDNQFTVQNNTIHIIAYLIDAHGQNGNRKAMQATTPLSGNITQAFTTITSPSGQNFDVKLYDDGTHGDEIAGDGKFTNKIPTNELGVYSSQTQIEGVRPDGAPFSRTITDLYPVVEKSLEFHQPFAAIEMAESGKSYISIPAKRLAAVSEVFVAGEIWGTNQLGMLEPVNWVGGIVEPQGSQSNINLKLKIDDRWLTQMGLKAPFELKNVRLQTVEDNVPLASIDSMTLRIKKRFRPAERFEKQSILTLTNDMMVSRVQSSLSATRKDTHNAADKIQSKISTQAAGGKLMLVHGYCSGNIWSTSQFSNSVEFQDYRQNRSHNEFARRIRDFGAQFPSFGIVAHSQGGAAALELYAKYWSGLDYADGGRLIQSVGTPYQGTALAGNAAILGQIFGVGCGKNTDLTYSGASNWLATIPSWARAQVDYYTTSFKTRWWAYDYCHLATDLFLNDPEDGTTEKWSGQLSGAVNKGHKKGWCHTTGMRDPAQYRDTNRNAAMNSNAAR